MSYKKPIYFLISNFFYEIFGKYYFSFKKNIYVCVIDYNFVFNLRNRLSCRMENRAGIKLWGRSK
jgi:hypothetical protein